MRAFDPYQVAIVDDAEPARPDPVALAKHGPMLAEVAQSNGALRSKTERGSFHAEFETLAGALCFRDEAGLRLADARALYFSPSIHRHPKLLRWEAVIVFGRFAPDAFEAATPAHDDIAAEMAADDRSAR